MVKMKIVLYVGRFSLEYGAAGIRARTMAKIFKANGYKTVFLCNTHGIDSFSDEFICKYAEYKSIRGLKGKVINTIDNNTGLFEYSLFRKMTAEYNPNIVILYNELYSSTKKIIKYCKSQGIHVVSDVTEWYEVPDSLCGHYGEYCIARSIDKRIRRLDKKADGIIVTSTFLLDYYANEKCRALLLPPVVSIKPHIERETSQETGVPILVYAGSPVAKDLITPVLDAVQLINATGVRIRFNIVGISENDLRTLWKDLDYQSLGVKCFGKIDHDKAMSIVANSDFTVLFRKPLRYAKAGYSYKFAESLSLGTPIICNSVGGCDLDISDYQNGFVLDDYNIQTLVECFMRIIEMDSVSYNNMRKHAKAFSKKYSEQEVCNTIGSFLGSI